MLLSITFQEWADSIFTPITYFVDWLKMVANSLMNNYIFVTLLCVVLSLSLIWVIFNFIIGFVDDFCYGIDKKLEKQKNYELYKDVQREYLSKHRNDEFDYLYDLMILKQQVLNGIYQNHSDLILDNKIYNYDLNAKALRYIKDRNKSDDDNSNDDDIDYLVPNKTTNNVIISSDELPKFSDIKNSLLQVEHEDVLQENIKEIDRIMKENKDLLDKKGLIYDSKSNSFVNKNTGEIISSDTYDIDLLRYNKFDTRMIEDNNFVRDYIFHHDLDYKMDKNNLDKFKKAYSYINYHDDDFDKHFIIQNNGWILDRLTNDEYYFDSNLPNYSTFNDNDNHNVINLGRFAYYDKKSKSMKTIMLPVTNNDLKDFQFDNNNLSDIDKEFISKNTLIRIK